MKGCAIEEKFLVKGCMPFRVYPFPLKTLERGTGKEYGTLLNILYIPFH
jgi:hypothetical protein